MPKKERNKVSSEHRDKDKDKARSHNPLFANTKQPQTQNSKKNKHYRRCQRGHLAIKINTIKVAKKDKKKDKVKNLSHIKYILANKKITILTNVPKRQKTSGGLDNFSIKDWQENGERIRMGTLCLVFHNLSGSNQDLAEL